MAYTAAPARIAELLEEAWSGAPPLQQIANYVVMQGEINIAIGDDPPAAYFSALWRQCENGAARYGGITDADDLRANLQAHCIPQGMVWPDVGDYDAFLKRRRLLMAVKIRDYYKSL